MYLLYPLTIVLEIQPRSVRRVDQDSSIRITSSMRAGPL